MSFSTSREAAGFSQKEAAKRIGVDQSAVSLWETGKTKPRASLLPAIAKLYGCTVDELLKASTDQDTA